MTKFDDIVGLGDETAEHLLFADEDDQLVVQGEAEIAQRIVDAAARAEATLREDLLSIQEYKGESQLIVEEAGEKKRKMDEIENEGKASMRAKKIEWKQNAEKIDEYKSRVDDINVQIAKIKREEIRLKEKLTKELVLSKAKLRIYSAVTGIEWDLPVAAANKPESVDGVFIGKNRSTTFHFDKSRKSSFEITNALWDLIDDEGGDDENW